MATASATTAIVNVPNVLSALRLVLAVVMFTLIPWQRAEMTAAALVVFIVAASTDWVDGYWARKYNQVTKLGRMLDPFVDKIIITGAYVMLAAEQLAAGQWFGITSWMAVVVVGREMLVTGLRSFIEQGGGDFSAKWSGKWKMVFQCLAVGAALVALVLAQRSQPIPAWIVWTSLASAYLAVAITIYSGVEYIVAAARLMRN